jgi:hypothetical protein
MAPSKGEMLQKGVRELGDREDEDEVEEQFDEAHPRVLVPSPHAQ